MTKIDILWSATFPRGLHRKLSGYGLGAPPHGQRSQSRVRVIPPRSIGTAGWLPQSERLLEASSGDGRHHAA
eukprot:6461007-Prymnesium_polylepis.1